MNRKFEDEKSYYIQGLARLVTSNIDVNIERLFKGKRNYILLPN
jgi:hypothetical protein